MRRLALLLTMLLLVAALGACGGGTKGDAGGSSDDDPTGDASTGTRANSGGELGGDTGYTVAGALTELPYAEPTAKAPVEVLTGDYQKATALAGQKRPTTRTPKAIVPWLRALNGDVTLPVAASTGLNSINVDPTGKALGFTAADVRFYAEERVGTDRFAVQTLYAGAHVRRDLPVRDGLRTTSTGAPGSPTSDQQVFLQFPRVNALAEAGQRVAFSVDPAQVKRWRAGQGKRLDDDPALAQVATALDAAKVYGASLVSGDFAPPKGKAQPKAIREAYDAVGVGVALAAQRPTVFVSYHFPGNVRAGAAQVATVWRDGTSQQANVPLEDYVEVRGTRTTGRVVTIELDASDTGPSAVLDMLTSRDTPFQDG